MGQFWIFSFQLSNSHYCPQLYCILDHSKAPIARLPIQSANIVKVKVSNQSPKEVLQSYDDSSKKIDPTTLYCNTKEIGSFCSNFSHILYFYRDRTKTHLTSLNCSLGISFRSCRLVEPPPNS